MSETYLAHKGGKQGVSLFANMAPSSEGGTHE
jgi:hypothetical protein